MYELMTYLAMLLGGWMIWGFLRALGFRPIKRRDETAAVCQGCGYNLYGTPLDGRCSECGELAANSIAAEARPGSFWQRRDRSGWSAKPWWRSSAQAILHPRRLGRELRVYRPTDDTWKLLAGHVAASGVMVVVGVLLGLGVAIHNGEYSRDVVNDVLWFTTHMAVFFTGVSVVAVSLIAAGLAGVWFSWTRGHNIMPVAMRVACHLAGFLTLWVGYLVVAILVCKITEYANWYIWIGRWSLDAWTVVVTLSCVLNLVWIWIYSRLIYMAVREAQYATR